MGWEQINQLLMPVIRMHGIRVVMLKSKRRDRVLLIDDVVGLEFDAQGLYLVVIEGF